MQRQSWFTIFSWTRREFTVGPRPPYSRSIGTYSRFHGAKDWFGASTRNYLACPRPTLTVACAAIDRTLAYLSAEHGACTFEPPIDATGGVATLFRNTITIHRTRPVIAGNRRGGRGGGGLWGCCNISIGTRSHTTHDDPQQHQYDESEHEIPFHGLDIIHPLLKSFLADCILET